MGSSIHHMVDASPVVVLVRCLHLPCCVLFATVACSVVMRRLFTLWGCACYVWSTGCATTGWCCGCTSACYGQHVELATFDMMAPAAQLNNMTWKRLHCATFQPYYLIRCLGCWASGFAKKPSAGACQPGPPRCSCSTTLCIHISAVHACTCASTNQVMHGHCEPPSCMHLRCVCIQGVLIPFHVHTCML